ncbi:MAG: FeoB small GTPase domain-containing protein, partial [Halanaerobium sp.]|nr:FeoB small GTPase domain-containing protein [Halanaerobium sp.]
MNCHQLTHITLPEHKKKIVLAGNPNTGKSVFYNTLTGMHADISNYPGTTVDINIAPIGEDILLDTPGVYGVSSFNDEERVARDVIINADLVVNIVNALNLDRDLFLTQQIIDMGIPVIVALNMMDEAEQQGMKIDVGLLSKLLGVPVIPTVAIRQQGIQELKDNLNLARRGHSLPGLDSRLNGISRKSKNRAAALLVLEDDPEICQQHNLTPGGQRDKVYQERRNKVNKMTAAVVTYPDNNNSLQARLSKV